MNYSKLILIGCFISSQILAQEKQNVSKKIVACIQSKAGLWGSLTVISSVYALMNMNKFSKDLYYDYTLKDHGNFWTADELRQLRIDRIRGHVFHHLPYVVIPLLIVALCAEETSDALQKEK